MSGKSKRQISIRCPNCEEHDVVLLAPGTTEGVCPELEPGRKIRLVSYAKKGHLWNVTVGERHDCPCECGAVKHTITEELGHPAFGVSAARVGKRVIHEMYEHQMAGPGDKVKKVKRATDADLAKWQAEGLKADNVWLFPEEKSLMVCQDDVGPNWNERIVSITELGQVLAGKREAFVVRFVGGEK